MKQKQYNVHQLISGTKEWYIYTVEYYLTRKGDEVLIDIAMWKSQVYVHNSIYVTRSNGQVHRDRKISGSKG